LFARFAAVTVACFAVLTASALADTTGVVRGTTTVEGKPAPGVTVTLTGEDTTQKTTTDASGRFTFPLVTYGPYAVVAHQEGYPDVTTQVNVSSSSVVSLTIALTKLKTIGKTTATSRSVSGAPVSVNTLGKAQIAALPSNNSLNSLVETVPGIVKFSYNEPVAHGFHGLTYEIDGAPLPQSTSSDFSEIIDPKAINSLEVFTGAFPAEYGGQRQGAVVNVVSSRLNSSLAPASGTLTFGGGSYGTVLAGLNQTLLVGKSQLYLALNSEQSNRGLDAPTFAPIHDNNSLSDQFLRYVTPAGPGAQIALNLSNQAALYQIPISTSTGNPFEDPVVSPATTDDVQREYNRFSSLVYTRITKDGSGSFEVAPWTGFGQVAYDGDIPNEIQQVYLDPTMSTCANGQTKCYLDGLRENRTANYTGLRISDFHSGSRHSVKFGVDGDIEAFASTATVAVVSANPSLPVNLPGPGVTPPPHSLVQADVAKVGQNLGVYIEDKWQPNPRLTINYGLRYDYSNGFVQGNQISPRIGVNLQADPKNIIHAYYGRLYSAPGLEDTRRDCVLVGDCPTIPVYDLKPEHDSYYEGGVAHTFSPTLYGYVNLWARKVDNVLDTTQLFPTPIFAVFNNSVGIADGIEFRLQGTLPNRDVLAFSGSVSESLAGGISGGTFLFPPSDVSDTTLQPEDHDQTYAANLAYTHYFGPRRDWFGTFSPVYGSGYPVAFENGNGRLPTHLTFDIALGRNPGQGPSHRIGFAITGQNITNHPYLIKVNNGFNTTQWAPGAQWTLKLIAPT
jgi:outer membrane receptor protein involved in Fe transport